MDAGIEGGKSEAGLSGRELAQMGKDMFIQVNFANPTSVIRQSARIAKKCKGLDVSPKLLGDNLLANQRFLRDIKEIGDRRHTKTGIRKALPIRITDLRGAITAGFGFAEDLVSLSEEQLREIYGSPNEGSTASAGDKERELIRQAMDWLRSVGKELSYEKYRLNFGVVDLERK